MVSTTAGAPSWQAETPAETSGARHRAPARPLPAWARRVSLGVVLGAATAAHLSLLTAVLS